uniref:Uncharacterized protein n=1 Tax=viral metagenome TaxID=1070528 RepID=A0A6C0IFL0_9ZZZZ
MNSSQLKCINIKSRHYLSEQCKNKVVFGKEFCSKHLKNPHRFIQKEKNIKQIMIIQSIWRKYSSRQYFKRQGPARGDLSVSNNQCELYSLEPLVTIPKIYIYSYSDTKKNIWCFDIRTLSFLLSKSKEIKNPYTRDVISKENINKIHNRLKWLKSKKYDTMYIDNTTFTSEQIWNQKVLDCFSKMEELGYIVNTDWFHEMDKEDHINFYKKLYTLWNYRLNLTNKEKNAIIPSHNSTRNKLFKIDDIELKEEKVLKKTNLQLIERFITSAYDKPQKGLGVMYILMTLVQIIPAVGETFPWIYASIL